VSRPRPAVIVHYHEIGLKRGNRPLFLRHLAKNLGRATSDLGAVRVRQLSGRILLDLDDHPAPGRVRDRVQRVCGVASTALAYRVPSTLEAMKAVVGRLVEGRAFASFRISARRAFKTYPLTSVELNRALGAFVLEKVAARVDLREPELEIHVEVMPSETFVYVDRLPGPGGLPVGASGTVAALLSGGIDSPVAAWRMMKRGCRVVFVHFHSVPYLPATSQAKARALVERLTAWQYESRLLLVRIAEALARERGALALATGESLGQVASQTLESIARIDEVATLPILRPLIGMDKLEITTEAQRLETFEVSIEPDADCCTLFVPAHPATRMSEAEVRAAEARLDVARLVTQGTAAVVTETFEFPARTHAAVAE